jgi:hypothetical protein
MVDPVALPDNLSPKAYGKPLRWLFKRNLKVCGLQIDDSNEELVPYIAESIHSVSAGITIHCIRETWDPFTYVQYPELIAKVVVAAFHPARNASPTEIAALPFHHLRALNWRSHNDVPAISLSQTIQGNPRLEKLTVYTSSRRIDGALISAVCSRFATLVHLSMRMVCLTDQDLLQIGKRCTLLTTFHLCILYDIGVESSVTDEGITAVVMGCEGIESLHLSGLSSLTSASLAAAFTHCAHLVDVSMVDVAITDAVLQARPQSSAPLQELCCRWCVSCTDDSVTHALSGLRELNIVLDTAPDSVDAFCCAMQWMTQLSGIELQHGPRFKSGVVPARAIHAIADHCHRLTKAKISANIYGNSQAALEALMRGNPGLRDISVWSERQCITDQVVLALAESCLQLRTLILKSATNLTDTSITQLARRCTALRILNLDTCVFLTDVSVLALAANCPGLTEVNFKRISEPAVVQLVRSCTKLTDLTVFDTSLSEETAQRLKDEHPQSLFIDVVTFDCWDLDGFEIGEF